MRLFELFADRLLELPLFEMAFQRRQLRQRVMNLEFQINSHLLKMLVMGYDDHWAAEATTHLNDIAKMRWDGTKVLREEEYFRLLYGNRFEGCETEVCGGMIQDIKDEYHLVSAPDGISVVYDLKHFHREIAKALASKAFSIAGAKTLLRAMVNS